MRTKLFAGFKGNTLGVTGTAAGLSGADFDFLGGTFVALGVIRTLLYAAHNTLDCVV